MDPKIDPRWPQDRSKTIFKSLFFHLRFRLRICSVLGAILGAILGPFWPSRSSKSPDPVAPCWALREDPKTPQSDRRPPNTTTTVIQHSPNTRVGVQLLGPLGAVLGPPEALWYSWGGSCISWLLLGRDVRPVLARRWPLLEHSGRCLGCS